MSGADFMHAASSSVAARYPSSGFNSHDLCKQSTHASRHAHRGSGQPDRHGSQSKQCPLSLFVFIRAYMAAGNETLQMGGFVGMLSM